MHNINRDYRDYRGLNGPTKAMLSNIAELSLLSTGKPERIYKTDEYGSARIEFADGTIFRVFIQMISQTGGTYHPAYLALKNHQGKVIPSSLWPSDRMEVAEGDFKLFANRPEFRHVA